MLYAEPCKNGKAIAALLSPAGTRGKLLKLMGHHLDADHRNMSDTAFTVGIMSLMHALFDMPMKVLLKQISVMPEVSEALLHCIGRYGDLLTIVESIEQVGDANDGVDQCLARSRLYREEPGALQLAAYARSDEVAREAY